MSEVRCQKSEVRRQKTESGAAEQQSSSKNYCSTAILLYCATVLSFLLLTSCNLYAARLTAHFIDVGQGDCIFIQLPNGKNILVDAGPADEYSDAGAEIVLPYLLSLGVQNIDALVVSHAHRDHIGGMSAIIKNMSIGAVYDTGFAHPSPVYERLLRMIKKGDIKYVVTREGTKITLDPAVDIRVLGPPKTLPWDDPNNNSIVLRIVYKNVSFLLTGDAEADAEDSLLRIYGYGLESNILKVSHHGSKSSSTEDFVYAVNPEIVIIQCGRHNRFRHPHHSVVRRFKDFGSEIYRNDLHGTIVVRTDGETYKVTSALSR